MNPTELSWQQRFRLPILYKLQVAQGNQSRSLLISNEGGLFQLHALDLITKEKHIVGEYPEGQIFGTIASNGEEIFAPKNSKSEECGHMHAYSFKAGTTTDLTPDFPAYTSFEVVTASHSRRICFFASMENDSAIIFIDRERKDVSPRILLRTNGQFGFPACTLSPDGTYCAIGYSKNIGGEEHWYISLLETLTGETVHTWPMSGTSHGYALHIQKTGDSFRILTQMNGRGFEEPAWLSTDTNEVEYLRNSFEHDVYPLAYDSQNNHLAVCAVHNGTHSLLLMNSDSSDQHIGPKNGSYDTYFGGATFLDSHRLIIRWQSGTKTPKIIEINPVTNETCDYEAIENAAVNTPFQSIECETVDGSTIQAWVGLPSNMTGPVPFVIDLHGGPDSVTLDAFSAEAQAWIDNGFGYCGLNYRGSISFGKGFQEKIIGRQGSPEVEDSIAIKKELVRRGWALENQCILTGYSWGGFVTLLGMGKSPKEWVAGVALVPIADWLTNYELIPSYLKALDASLFGGTPEEVPDRYEKASPKTYVSNLHAPVLIIAGEYDIRCPIEQVRSYINAAKALKKDVEFRPIEMGHIGSFGNAKLSIKIYTEIFDFLHKKKIPLETRVSSPKGL